MTPFHPKLRGLMGVLASQNGEIHFYVINHLIRALFETGGDLPTASEARGEIQEALTRLGRQIAVEADDTPGEQPHYQVYNRLKLGGWIEEIPDRYRVLVNLPPEAETLFDLIRRFVEATKQSYGADVRLIHELLESALRPPHPDHVRAKADKLIKAAEAAEKLSRHFRVVLSAMRRIESKIVKEQTTHGAVDIFFNDFVAKTLVTDWAMLKTERSPLRRKGEILDLCEGALAVPDLILAAAQGLVVFEMQSDLSDAQDAVLRALEAISATFHAVGELQERIDRMTSRVQARVNARLNYLDSVDGTTLRELEEIRARLNDPNCDEFLLPCGLLQSVRFYDRLAITLPPDRRPPAFEAAPVDEELTEADREQVRRRSRFQELSFIPTERLAEHILQGLNGSQMRRVDELTIDSPEGLISSLMLFGLSDKIASVLQEEHGIEITRGEAAHGNKWFTGPELTISRKSGQAAD